MLVLPLITGFYVMHLEDYKKITNIVWDFILEETKHSLQYGHLIILNILTCKHVYKKYIDLMKLKDKISEIIKSFDFEESQVNNEYYYNVANSENEKNIFQQNKNLKIYSSLFNIYENIDEFSKRNLTNLTNIKEYINDKGKIKWNRIMLNKRKNDQIKNKKENENWMHYISEINYINDLVTISDILRNVPLESRAEEFKNFLHYINKELLPSFLYHPIDDSDYDYSFNKTLLRIDIDHSYSINTKERCPCLLFFEYSAPVDTEEASIIKNPSENSSDNLFNSTLFNSRSYRLENKKLTSLKKPKRIGDDESFNSDTMNLSDIGEKDNDIKKRVKFSSEEFDSSFNYENKVTKTDGSEDEQEDTNPKKKRKIDLNDINNHPRKSAEPSHNKMHNEIVEKLRPEFMYSSGSYEKSNKNNNSIFGNLFSCGCFDGNFSNENEENTPNAFNSGIFGKYSFEEIKDIVKKNSKFQDTNLYPYKEITTAIVKGGDELRQDFFVGQIIALTNSIFEELDSSLNIFMRELSILSNGNGGFIETIVNSISLSKINKIEFKDYKFNDDIRSGYHSTGEPEIPEFNLKKYFLVRYKKNTQEYHDAVSNFISSLAGYSLICYFLEIKDRNNGNILLDEFGHLIHIDFGFLLSKSPGNLGFEKSPFKLTMEFIELMGGVKSSYFLKFQELFFRGFSLLRQKADIFIGLIRIFCDVFSDLSCFNNKEKIIADIREKFMLDIKNEEELVKKCNDIIFMSIDNWRTNAYDKFQKFCVGIS